MIDIKKRLIDQQAKKGRNDDGGASASGNGMKNQTPLVYFAKIGNG